MSIEKAMENYKDIKTFDELIELEHGKMGSESRNKYEEGAQMFIVNELLNAVHKDAKMQLSEKSGVNRS